MNSMILLVARIDFEDLVYAGGFQIVFACFLLYLVGTWLISHYFSKLKETNDEIQSEKKDSYKLGVTIGFREEIDYGTKVAYENAMRELEDKTYDRATWARALIFANGDEQTAKVRYLIQRVEEQKKAANKYN